MPTHLSLARRNQNGYQSISIFTTWLMGGFSSFFKPEKAKSPKSPDAFFNPSPFA
jgi:hypothetical protein